MIRILLADDHPYILRGVEQFLAEEDDIEIVGKETDPKHVVKAVTLLEPDILVQDLSMGDKFSGLEIIQAVREQHPATRIVVLTMLVAIATAWEAFQHGANGYVTKLGDFTELVEAIRQVHSGKRYVGLPLTGQEIDEYDQSMRLQGAGPMSALTKRELQVVNLVAHGHTSAEIAEALHIGRRTVESHRANVLTKLGLRNKSEIVRYAIERGLVPPR